ncbi:MAG: hypothetical protein HFE99_09155 [Ruminiclostridium sp.]|jgi:hypothetical protein|nr:hypothetical protein [Ruminiclostridium sp.]
MLEERDLQEIDRLMAHRMNIIIESDVMPKFNLLAEGIQDIQEKLLPRSRVDDLEDEMKFLKVMIRQMAERISELEKAN